MGSGSVTTTMLCILSSLFIAETLGRICKRAFCPPERSAKRAAQDHLNQAAEIKKIQTGPFVRHTWVSLQLSSEARRAETPGSKKVQTGPFVRHTLGLAATELGSTSRGDSRNVKAESL